MPRIAALEWNGAQARLLVATRRGDRVVVDHALGVPLDGADESGVGARIAAALAARGLGRLDALVALGRAQVELRQFTVPPCPAEELPEVVRFQAMKEFSALRDDWSLDFVPLGDEVPVRTVLAAAVDPGSVAAIRRVCQAAGLRLRRLVLRPCGTTSLWRRFLAAAGAKVRLLVDLLDDEAELTVIFDGREMFLRGARVPGNPLDHIEAVETLLSEMRRTIGAAQNQFGGRRVESIVLCGNSDAHQALARQIAERLALPVETFDPFGAVVPAGDARQVTPAESGCFGALLGIACDQLEHAAPALDFVQPRRRPKPQGYRVRYVLGGLVAVLAVAAAALVGWQSRCAIRDEVGCLEAASAALERPLARAEQIEKAAAEIDKWVAEDVVWLEQLRWLCESLPPAEDVMLTRLSLRPTTTGGEMDIQGRARTVETISVMEGKLRDSSHVVVGKDKGADSSQPPYTMNFRSSIIVKQETPQ